MDGEDGGEGNRTARRGAVREERFGWEGRINVESRHHLCFERRIERKKKVRFLMTIEK